mgnify:CR=1 FL=1
MVNIMDIDIRKYIISNFKDDSIDDIRKSIDKSIESNDEEPLIGLGVFFEILWKNAEEETKLMILNEIKKTINNCN